MIESCEAPRQRAAAVAVSLTLLVLPFFYGMPVNAVVFMTAVLLVLAAAALVGSDRIALECARHPWPVGLAIYTLAMLALNYQWTQSRDTSFAPAWSLALLPLTFLVVSSLGRLKWLVYAALVAMALVFSTVSLLMAFRSGIVAAFPLTDPNNYASLLYMALIPGAWLYLRRSWQGDMGGTRHGLVLTAFALLVGALYATQSRTAAVIVWAALAIFLVVCITRREKPWALFAMIVIALAAYPVVQIPLVSESPFAPEDLSRGTAVRMALNRAAFDVYLLHPITGAGINLFPLLYRQMRDPADQSTAGIWVHNDYLQLLAEGGLLLLLPLVVLAFAVGWRFARALFSRQAPGPEFGVVTALAAILAHALVNFVLMTGILAVVIGVAAAVVPWGSARDGSAAQRVRLRWGLRAGYVFGWAAFGYLVLDTYSLGVYQRQPGIPFTERFSRDAAGMLSYSRFAQALNANRGLPVLAEAAVYRLRLDESPESTFLQDLVLHTYRRAIAVDPWNSNAFFAMYEFVKAHPALADRLLENETPEQLLLRSLALDPVFLPALEAFRADAEAAGTPERAYRVVRQHLGPWLVWLARSDPEDAERWLNYLRDWADRTADSAYLTELDAAAAGIARIERSIQVRLKFD